jgi:menaquinone-dependent protoporphyrinogen oxidase
MKKKILLVYSTTDGQTTAICEKIKSVLIENNLVDLIPINKFQEKELKNYDQVIVGASIRYGKHKPEVYKFIKTHQNDLKTKITGFFSVNVVARKPNKNTPLTNPYMKKFLEMVNWEPNYLAVFAGKIDYQKHRFIDRHMIRLIMFITKGPTDLKGVFEFTDWQNVENFAGQFS